MFKFGSKSLSKLYLVHPFLVEIAEYAIEITPVDFGIFEGLRTVEQERENIKDGSSKLTNPRDCKHCVQKDGWAHAIDAVPFIDGAFRWDWDGCFSIARAFQLGAVHHGVIIRWGGVWDKPLNSLGTNLNKEVDDYRVRHVGKDFLDGVHFELVDSLTNNTINDKALTS